MLQSRDSPTKAERRRQARTVRHRGRGTGLTERDIWLLEALAKMRFLTTGQIAVLGFEGSRWAANKRLRKLLDGGLVCAWVRHLAEENVYSVDRMGARRLGDGKEAPRVPRGLDGNLDHLLAINQFRIALALGLEKAAGEIAWWRSDWELRGNVRACIVPDAFFAIRWAREERIYVLEADNNTRSARQFLRKLLGYASLLEQGGGAYRVSDLRVLVVTRDAGWLERYRQSLRILPMKSQVWFTTLAEAKEERAVGRIWKRTDEDIEYSLQELSTLPYGKDGGSSLTTSVACS